MRLMVKNKEVTLATRPGSMGLLFAGIFNPKTGAHFGIHIFPRRSPVVKYFGYEPGTYDGGPLNTVGLGPLLLFVWGW
jgi:hypothetical protein